MVILEMLKGQYRCKGTQKIRDLQNQITIFYASAKKVINTLIGGVLRWGIDLRL
jgi:hypothetical protein